MIGKDLSWECTATGNCLVAAQPPNPSSGFFPSHAACALAPGGKCFAPGNMTISYECHGTHFGCVPKSEKADEKTKFANVDDCEAKCHIVPTGMSFGCSGSRPTGCVLLNTPPNPPSKYFAGIGALPRVQPPRFVAALASMPALDSTPWILLGAHARAAREHGTVPTSATCRPPLTRVTACVPFAEECNTWCQA